MTDMTAVLHEAVPDAKRGLLSLVGTAADLERRIIRVPDDVAPVLPGGGLVRGQTVSLTGAGSTWFCLRMVSSLTREGGWAAFVGDTTLSAPAIVEAEVALDRLAVVRDPGDQFVTVADALAAALDVVVLNPPAIRPAQARSLASRAKERGTVLVVRGEWPVSTDVELRMKSLWEGLGYGHGRLERRDLEVQTSGRRVPSPAGHLIRAG